MMKSLLLWMGMHTLPSSHSYTPPSSLLRPSFRRYGSCRPCSSLHRSAWLKSTVDEVDEETTNGVDERDVPFDGVNVNGRIEKNESDGVALYDSLPDLSNTKQESPAFLQTILDKIGKIDESRLMSTLEYRTGQEPKLFSNLQYQVTSNNQTTVIVAKQSQSNVFSSAALLCGTCLGTGLTFLPSAIQSAGYVPTILATLVAWGYMTVSALLTAELLINRCGETGKVRNVGLLELYETYLGPRFGKVATIGFVAVCYVIMGMYFSEGGDALIMLTSTISSAVLKNDIASAPNIATTDTILQSALLSRTIFASTMGIFLATASKFGAVQRVMTNVLVPSTLIAFAIAVTMALPTADFSSLIDLSNQHPEFVLNAFPMLFMSWSSHAVVPRVVYDLEGDTSKIKTAIWGGFTSALVMYLIWNAIISGNALGDENAINVATTTTSNIIDPISLVHSTMPQLQTSIATVSELAIVTSLIGLVLGFVNEFYDAIGALPSRSYGPKQDNKWQVALLTLTPSVLFSILLGYYKPDLDRQLVMDYTGAFGASTLFLILPALMVWQNRYGDDARPLTVKPMFPLGKITLGSLYKAAGTLIVEQGLEKLGLFEYVSEHFLKNGNL